jgi:cyclic pyranopterin phosphate synthase
MPQLQDSYGRVMRTLRLSVTQRCNLRCRYCMPACGRPAAPAVDLGLDEMLALASCLRGLGLRRVKLTGGEPLLYGALTALVAGLKGQGYEEVSLTTNGLDLARQAAGLKRAGLDRVTVSLDALEPELYGQITRGGDLEDVLRGLREAEAVGLTPLKLNAVILRDWNRGEAVKLAAQTLTRPWHLRFIEYMPLDPALGLPHTAGVRQAELAALLQASLGDLTPLASEPSAPERCFRLPGALGSVGFISPLSARFCGQCDRLRLSSEGKLQLCLSQPGGLDLAALLRAGLGSAELSAAIVRAVQGKPYGHDLEGDASGAPRPMSAIGG